MSQRVLLGVSSCFRMCGNYWVNRLCEGRYCPLRRYSVMLVFAQFFSWSQQYAWTDLYGGVCSSTEQQMFLVENYIFELIMHVFKSTHIE